MVRVTGRFPLPYFGFDALPATLPFCPICKQPDAKPEHLLGECPASLAIYISSISGSTEIGCVFPAVRPPWQHFQLVLFTWSLRMAENRARFEYVGRCCELLAAALQDVQ